MTDLVTDPLEVDNEGVHRDTDGDKAIERDLATVDVHCAGLQTDVDTAAFALPIGSAGQVTVRVVCPLDLSDAVIPGLPGQLVVAATASEPLDRFRERKP